MVADDVTARPLWATERHREVPSFQIARRNTERGEREVQNKNTVGVPTQPGAEAVIGWWAAMLVYYRQVTWDIDRFLVHGSPRNTYDHASVCASGR